MTNYKETAFQTQQIHTRAIETITVGTRPAKLNTGSNPSTEKDKWNQSSSPTEETIGNL